MPHSLNHIWIHAVWSTKDRLPLLSPEIEEEVFNHMYTLFKEISCPAEIINGMPDHVHCLFLLNRNLKISYVIKKIKGNTSHWINENKLTLDYFAWQVGYSSFSISDSHVQKVKRYIRNQKKHHSS
jgi:REP element-mobilizing transposase RayT